MNDFVLRGFCKKCGRAIELHKLHVLDDSPNDYKANHIENTPIRCTQTSPVWFLSPAQMKIVSNNVEYLKWSSKKTGSMSHGSITMLIAVLELDPFLVAKILKEAGEKKEIQPSPEQYDKWEKLESGKPIATVGEGSSAPKCDDGLNHFYSEKEDNVWRCRCGKTFNESNSAPKIVIDRAVNITKNPDALFDVALSDEEWKKKYPSTPKEKSKEENK